MHPEESIVDNEEDALNKVLTHKGYAMMSDKTSLGELVRKSGNCEVMFMDQEFFKSGYGIVIKKGAPYRRQFDKL